MSRKVWLQEEIDIIKKMYINFTNKEISLCINATPKQINQKGVLLGFRKSKEIRSKNIGIRNKIVGRDLNYDFVKKEALKYKTKSEFQKKDASSYQYAKTKNILSEICDHMIPQSFSIPQMMLYELLIKTMPKKEIIYNTRKIINPYEIDIFLVDNNIAFEYNGKGWHLDNKNDVIKEKILIEKNIKLFVFVENNRNYEEDVKIQFLEKLDEINNICNMNITIDEVKNIKLDIVYDNLLNKGEIKELCLKYDNFTEFRKKEFKLYNKLFKMKKLKEYTSHMKRSIINWDYDKIINEINKYNTLKDFYENSNGCYIFISRNKEYKYLLNKLKSKF